MRILVVDDDETTRTELAELLRGNGHDVVGVDSGEAAIESVRRRPPDAVLVDLMMFGMDGLETLRSVRAISPETGVVLITGHGTVDTAVEAMKSGAFDYVLKPFEIDSIQRVLRAFADHRSVSALVGGSALGLDAIVDAFLAAATGGGLCLLDADSPPPAVVTRSARIRTMRIGTGAGAVRPGNLGPLIRAVEDILRGDGSAILVACLRPVLEVHGEETVAAWLRQVAERARERGAVLIVAATTDRERAIGQRVQTSIASVRQQAILESLANPIRRGIVQFLAGTTEASYSDILRARFADSSPKLSFHLQKLLADGVAAKRTDGKYALTPEGARAARLTSAIGASETGPLVVVVDRRSGVVNRT